MLERLSSNRNDAQHGREQKYLRHDPPPHVEHGSTRARKEQKRCHADTGANFRRGRWLHAEDSLRWKRSSGTARLCSGNKLPSTVALSGRIRPVSIGTRFAPQFDGHGPCRLSPREDCTRRSSIPPPKRWIS